MFKKIEVYHFRGIREAVIDDLGQVNLFWGKNNCGKSSLLDALFLVAGMSNPMLPLTINQLRQYNNVSPDGLKVNFYGFDTQTPIRIVATDGDIRELTIEAEEIGATEVNTSGSGDGSSLSSTVPTSYGLRLHYSMNGGQHESSLLFDPIKGTDQANRTIDNAYEERLKCLYLTPKYDFRASVQGLANILQNKDEQFILDGLRLIEPSVKDFVFTGGEMLVDVGASKRLPVNVMGDGARKIVSLLTTIYDCANGVLLVDELSNGFHYSVMPSLWKVVAYAARKNKTQVFATTHDIDSIKGLRTMALNEPEGKGLAVSAYKLQRNADDVLTSYRYSAESMNYAFEQEMEIR